MVSLRGMGMKDISEVEWSNYRIAIIMANYNKAVYIRQAIESVLMQRTRFEYILVIVDDCSTDGSADIIQMYEELYPQKILTVFSTSNRGYFASQMMVYPYMKTDYYTLLDPDDYWTNSAILEEAVLFLEKNLDFTACGFNTQIEEKGELIETPLFCKTHKEEIIYEGIEDYFAGKCIMPHTSATIYRNVIYKKGIPKLFIQAGEGLAEASFRGDTDRFIMYLKYGRIAFKNKIVSVYRIYEGGIWSGASPVTRCLMRARAQLDYSDFYDCKYERQFADVTRWDRIEIVKSIIEKRYACREEDRQKDIGNYQYLMHRLCMLSNENVTEEDLNTIWEFINEYNGQPVIIWGCGDAAENMLQRYQFTNIKYFVDSNSEKQGKPFHGVLTKAPDEIDGGFYVILMSMHYQEIEAMIRQRNLCDMDCVVNLYGYENL